MPELSIQSLPYQADPLKLFGLIRHLPWAQLLDSSGCKGELSRYDILCADPVYKLTTQQQLTAIESRSGEIKASGLSPFETLQSLMDSTNVSCDLPFCGGALGYFGYHLLDDSYDDRPNCHELPDMAVGIYDWAIVSDHHLAKTVFVAKNSDPKSIETCQWLLEKLAGSTQTHESKQTLKAGQLDVDIDFRQYQQDFEKIQRYLHDGDCYQINYARCFSAEASGAAWESYQQLRNNNPVPFGAYLEFPFASILSASPERFLKVTNGQVETRPIKGTRPRASAPREDQALRQELADSNKDQAENLMIVDLLRNDLGKTCVPGSIKVDSLFRIETYPTVYHMVSVISGQLQADKNPIDVLHNCFPGGSITGAPKKRAMQIIAELEKHRRGIYCGAIGYFSYNGNLDTNIAIRTMTVADNKLSFWAGGGIVADSDCKQEFQETRDKAKAFLMLLETDVND